VLRHNFIPYRIARTLMAMKAIRQANCIAAVSPYVAKHLERFFFPRRMVDVITNGLPNSIFEDREWTERPKSEVLTFFTILNGWGGLKNGQVAIQAFAKLGETFRPARLVMFGAGHNPGGPAELWARERGLSDGIEFAGSVAYEILQSRICKECDILVHPSLEESQGMAIIESLSKGVPAIGGENAGAVPWTLDFGKAGMLVDVRSPEKVAAAMLTLVQDSELRKRLSVAGYRRTRRHFGIEAVADAYERKYEGILTER
jgi:glycosyltransferase involved in cell wall biosynthesis